MSAEQIALIAEQALEISALKKWKREATTAFGHIVGHCAGIGAPLNDCAVVYSKEQLEPLRRILAIAEDMMPSEEPS